MIRRRQGEDGQAAIELLGLLPILLLVGLAVLQTLMVAQAAVATEQAARAAARVAMVEDGQGGIEAAAAASLPSWLRPSASTTWPSGDRHRVRVEVRVPVVVPGISATLDLHRTAEMPELPEWD
jgi:hypothetical protein